MAAHRYWRVVDISIPGGGLLEIGEWQLFNGASRVDASATLSSSSSPSFGSVADLKDGSVSTRVYWDESTVENPAFWIKWDFGSAQTVDGTRFSGYDNSTRYPSGFTFQWSDDNSSWTTQRSVSGVSYPGNNTYTDVIALVPPHTVAGVVKDASGSPLSGRTVRVYRRDTGALLAETTSATSTGIFSLTIYHADPVTVVVLGADGGSENALIFDRVIPV